MFGNPAPRGEPEDPVDFEGASLNTLTLLLKDPSPAVQADAACTLGDRLRTGELPHLPDHHRSLLIDLIASAPFPVQLEAAITLAEVQDPQGTPVLVEAVSRRDFRLDAISALGTMADPVASPVLEYWLNKRWAAWVDRLQAAAALCRLGHADGAAYLQSKLRSRRRAERAAALHFMGESKHPSALKHLLEILHDANDPLRDVAARTLGILGDAAAIEPLLTTLPQADAELSADIRTSLTQLKTPG